MQTWWNSSPYKAVAFYIGASSPLGWRSCPNGSLDAAWVRSVSAMGWGLIPIWVGPQANTARFSSPLVSADSVTAAQQGRDEASRACDAAASLGLSPQTIIYYDMEAGWSTSYRSAVQAFVNGWVQGMHARQNLAGVYSERSEFQYWTPAFIANPPDSIWFNWFFQDHVPCGNACHTVTGAPSIADSLWAGDQRIRQTSSTLTSGTCYGGVCFTGNSGIDEDWVDGPVATLGSSGADTVPPVISSFTVTPNSIAVGSSFSIQATVSDSGGSGLNRVELWRAPDAGGTPGTWSTITSTTLSGNGPTSVSFSNGPPTAGTYWYGIHVFDNSGNQTNEPNGPISRIVTGSGGGGGASCSAFSISSGQTLNGTLGPGCLAPHRSGSYAQLYTFTATAGSVITVTETATTFSDTYLYLISPNSQVVAQDDDSAGNLNSRIVYTASSSGPYTIEATSFNGSVTGNFTISLTVSAGGGGGGAGNLQVAFAPNPVPRAPDGSWSYSVTLTETGGQPVTLTGLIVGGNDYTQYISSWFGSNQIPARGQLAGNFTTTGSPGSITWSFSGNGQTWSQSVTLQP
ncbi:MAG: DUF1906 domain-containing protein [Acidobacteria bacterium]|nr:DUF1906 domain-containing protein [Acidobacteriota bacterium]